MWSVVNRGLDRLRTHRDFPKHRRRSCHMIGIFLEKHEKLKTLVYSLSFVWISLSLECRYTFILCIVCSNWDVFGKITNKPLYIPMHNLWLSMSATFRQNSNWTNINFYDFILKNRSHIHEIIQYTQGKRTINGKRLYDGINDASYETLL